MAKSKKQPKRREKPGKNKQQTNDTNGQSFDDVLRENEQQLEKGCEKKGFLNNPLHLAILCALLSLGLYWNTHSNDFAYDDYAAIVYNPDTRGTTPVGDLLKNDFWGQTLALAGSNKSWRPLTVLSFRINHTFHGLNPSAFHVWNNVLNAITAFIAVFTLSSLQNGSSFSYLIVSSLLFTFHPIHTEAVTNTVGRAESIGAILAFLAFYFHRKSMTNTNNQSFIFVIIAMILGFTSALAKEPCLMVLGICGAHEIGAIWLPMTTSTNNKGKKGGNNHSINWKELGPSIARFIMLAATGVGYMSMRVIINGEGLGVKPQFKDNPLLFTDSKLSFILTALHIQATYTWKLLYPMNFCCDYGYNVIPMVEGLDDIRNVWTAVWMIGLLGLILKGLMDAREKSDSRLLIALAWIVAPLIPASHILALGTVLAERLLYVPSLGYGMIVGLVVEYFVTDTKYGKGDDTPENDAISSSTREKSRNTKFMSLLPVFGVVLAYYSKVIIERNKNWENDTALWKADFKTHPDNVKISTMYTRLLNDAGEYQEAMKISQEKYEMLPDDIGNMIVLAKATAFSGVENGFETAHEILDKGVAIVEGRKWPKSFDFEIFSSKGYLLSKQNRIEEAREFYKKALDMGSKRNPESEKPFCNMGEIEAVAGNWETSVPFLERCANNIRAKKGGTDKDDYVKYLENLVKAYYMSKRYEQVIERAPESLAIRETDVIRRIYDDALKKLAKRREQEAAAGGGGGE